MNFPLINYDILYSPEPKKEPQKPKPLSQTPLTSSSSLSSAFLKDRPLAFLKSPISTAKSSNPSDFSAKPLISTNLASSYNISLVSKPVPKPANEKALCPANNLECFKVFARIRPLSSKEIALNSQSKKPNFAKTVTKLDDSSVIPDLVFSLTFLAIRSSFSPWSTRSTSARTRRSSPLTLFSTRATPTRRSSAGRCFPRSRTCSTATTRRSWPTG